MRIAILISLGAPMFYDRGHEPFEKKPAVPKGVRLYAVGDVHGCIELLRRLMQKIEADAASHSAETYDLVFLGDYIDRGLHSKETIDFLRENLPPFMHKVFLRGNHDDGMLRFLDGDFTVLTGWLTYGGMATLANYGVNPFRPRAVQEQAALHTAFTAKVPLAHRTFLLETQHSYTCGDYYFAHAGVKPGVSIAEQSPLDLLWVRNEFLSSKLDHGKVIVHGHTVAPEPEVFHNRIGIDTGAYASGHLTCLVLEGTDRTFLST